MTRGRRRRHRRTTARRGFTLLELLIASAMMAVLAGAVYSAMRVAFKARDRALSAMGPARAAELAMDMVRRDLDSALPLKGVLAGQGTFLGRLGGEVPDTAAVEFYALGRRPEVGTTPESRNRAQSGASAGERQDPTTYGGVRRVDLLVTPASGGGGGDGVLVRRVTRNLLAPTDEIPEEEVICHGVTAFTVRFFDGYQWNNEWDSTQYSDVLPLAVEVTLEVAGPRDPTAPMDPAGPNGFAQGNRETYRTTRTFLLPARDENALLQGVTQ